MHHISLLCCRWYATEMLVFLVRQMKSYIASGKQLGVTHKEQIYSYAEM